MIFSLLIFFVLYINFNTNFLVRPSENFKFEKISAVDLSAIMENMNAKCSPGFDGIPFKIFAESSRKILPFLEMLFNRILSENYIPSDFKCAVVTPLFKGKGSKHECTNYRGISILSPVTKLFETNIGKRSRSRFKYQRSTVILNVYSF